LTYAVIRLGLDTNAQFSFYDRLLQGAWIIHYLLIQHSRLSQFLFQAAVKDYHHIVGHGLPKEYSSKEVSMLLKECFLMERLHRVTFLEFLLFLALLN
jgi:hypothetical protein